MLDDPPELGDDEVNVKPQTQNAAVTKPQSGLFKAEVKANSTSTVSNEPKLDDVPALEQDDPASPYPLMQKKEPAAAKETGTASDIKSKPIVPSANN